MNAYAYAILAVLFWGSAPVFEKLGLQTLPPSAGIFIRSVIATVGTAVMFTLGGNGWGWVSSASPRALFFLALAGFNSAFLGQYFYFSALKLGEASRIVPLCSTYPFVAFVLSIFILGESITLSKVAGMGCVLLGIYLLRV